VITAEDAKMSHFYSNMFSILFAFASVFLIFIVLLQRGRGGGLAGAFGATGGQSAFGTKAGDVFTRITIGVAVAWVALAAATTFAMRAESTGRFHAEAPEEPGMVPALPPSGAGADTHPFEAGDQGTKSSPAAKGAASPKDSKQPAPGKSVPPAKNQPATDAKGSASTPNK
jgi:preprotein translocase subunit SecG